ncbi:MAG TPA: SDR family NAD(P)-dependent oxidoreductase [Ideonella sp.]|uniref:SDR family NAD(P)-dependent oxidoreductase n=1 Tax=Ideonella sp. TaxID=1929293 RepID=UPI002C859F1F|nr:SDR family NAD(P)-dependent oxidoreductase [Ideonella sp.]HSI49090.1 SDR family NAD(P)-dependent oxidoreductase [Ideonella sp.]
MNSASASPLHDTAVAGTDIAIIGMAGRFPGAPDLASYWRLIRDGAEALTPLSDATLRAQGVGDAQLADPDFVKAGLLLPGVDQFDAALFGYSPREAAQLDPQQRLFLECAWEALEHAGHHGEARAASVGVYAGEGPNLYLMQHLLPGAGLAPGAGISDLLGLMSGNSSGSLCTRVAYKLDLRGPAVSVQTECSTSLVAVHMACQALLSQECDMALAGGVWLNLLAEGGYQHQPGAILSPDGHCRAFDAQAAGTVIGSGAGIVVLKRLDEALRDGDTVHAIIKATAVNNDGADKIGFTAPSIAGQSAVIQAALALAGVSPRSIGYVEAHGTGTVLGDPIEVAALTDAFRVGTADSGFCALGSAKTQIGHLDAAAGVAGLIRAALALQHATLPPSLHFTQPNPRIDFARSPFYVNTQARPWPAGDTPRRAGVSSFGIGGTNAHVVLEEAPAVVAEPDDGAWQVLPLAAQSATAVRQAGLRLATELQQAPGLALADVAFTLQTGRRAFAQRGAVVARELAQAAAGWAAPQLQIRTAGEQPPEVVFLFPGGGTQHAGMGLALYQQDAAFRAEIDACCALLQPELGLDLRTLLFPAPGHEAEANRLLARMDIAQPALFVIDHALAQWWLRRGVRPAAMLGHSLGEYVAACVAGVFTRDDALRLVAARGRLLHSLPAGAMSAVTLAPEALAPLLQDSGCDLAAVNAEQVCVFSGPEAAVATLAQRLLALGHSPRRLHVAVASHSAMTEPLLPALQALVASVPRQAPGWPFISNVTGQAITAEQAQDPAYWAAHLRSTVRFADGLNEALRVPGRVLLEVGPGETLAALSRQHAQAESAAAIVASQAHAQQPERHAQQLAQALATLWTAGVAIDWRAHHAGHSRRRVPLPGYAFQRRRHWVERSGGAGTAAPAEVFHAPTWSRLPRPDGARPVDWVLVLGELHCSLATAVFEQARQQGRAALWAQPGASFQRHGPQHWTLPFDSREALARLLTEAIAAHGPAGQVLHLASLGTIAEGGEDGWLARHYAGLLALAQALDAAEPGVARQLALTLVGQGMEDITGSEPLWPERSMLQGLAKVMGQESPGLQVRVLDLLPPAPESAAERQLAAAVLAEALCADTASPLALRGPHRWHKTWAPLALTPAASPRLRRQGVYLITGGLGGVGLALAQHLAQHWQASLVLLGRSALPPRAQWPAIAEDPAQPAPLRERLATLLALEAAGAQVLTLAADVADAAAVRQAIAQARQHFGQLHGVVHAAGDAGGGMIAHRSLAQAQAVWAAKRLGSRALLAALDEAPAAQAPDFVLLCSSIASLAGGLGMSDYAAANLYLDALATARHREGGYPVISVNWDAWRELGMARGLVLPEGLGMSGPEGALAFERIVNGPAVPQVVIATTDLARRLGPLDSSLLEGLDEADASAPAPAAERHARPALATPFVAPASALEQLLAAAWSERLGLAPVGLHDNFFELGGDSLVAIQLLSRLRKSHGLALHPSEFFKAPTLAALAAHMGAQQAEPAASQLIAPVPRDAALPLSPMQRRLWLVDRLGSADDALGRAAYNMSAALDWHGALDPVVLAQAINAIVARHETLRTVFTEDGDGAPMAQVHAALQIPLPLTDLSPLPEAERESRFLAGFDAFIREPFALDRGPLMQAALVRLAPQHHVLMLSLHHIVFDGWSIAVFAQELGQNYAALLAHRPLARLPLAVQYLDYAAWYAASLAAPEGQASARFWRGQLAGAPALSALPADHARPARASQVGAVVSTRLDPGLTDALQRLARAHEASLFQVLLAAFLALAHRACGQQDLVIGTDVAGRRHPDLEPLIGFFVNVVPLRSRLPAATGNEAWPSFTEWLQASQRAALQALDHQLTPFDEIVELAGVPRQRDRNPLVQTLFVLQNTPEVRFELPGARIEVLPQQLNESKFDLAVFVRQDGGTLQVDWVYATALYRRETVARHAQAWQQLLQAIVQQPNEPLHTLMPSPERLPMTADPSSPTATPPRKLDTSAKLAALQALKGARAAAPVQLVGGALQARPLQPGRNFPLVLQAQAPGLDLAAWARGHADEVEALLARHGGLLFRNTGLHTPQDFERFAEAIEPQLYGSYGDLPKKEGGRNTYRSTPYPEDEMILFHNESAHLERWPRKQWFFCELPSPVGGATPIVDGREMLRRLPAELVAEFERRELLYVRTFLPGLDVPWREFFKTDDRAAVEARLAAAGIAWRWFEDDALQTRTRCPAVIVHPVTGERVFFNQVQLHHTSCLAPEVRADLLETVGAARMPRQVCFGDGEPIPDATMATIGQAYEACAVRFDWRQGDVVMLDNMLAAHARDPYQGPRKIVVAMGAMFERTALAPLASAKVED